MCDSYTRKVVTSYDHELYNRIIVSFLESAERRLSATLDHYFSNSRNGQLLAIHTTIHCAAHVFAPHIRFRFNARIRL